MREYFADPMIRQNAENNAKRGATNSHKIKKITSNARSKGKKNASKAINHHLSGCKNALQQASRKRIPSMIFSTMKIRLVNFRNEVMERIAEVTNLPPQLPVSGSLFLHWSEIDIPVD